MPEENVAIHNQNPRLPRMLFHHTKLHSLQGQAIRSNSSIVPHNKWQFTQNAQRWSKLLWSFTTTKNEALQIFPFVTLMKQYLECFSWFNYAQFLERPLHSNSQLAQAENAGVTFSYKICRDLLLKIQSGIQFLSVKVVMNIHDDCMMILRFRNLKWKIKNR